jgi:hypothetical protein
MAVELLEAARSGTADFAQLCRYMDAAIAKVILSQTMTTDDGASLAQAKVHSDVKLEVVKADADLLCESFNAGPATWWRDLNFPGAATPRLVRHVAEKADLKALADTDAVLKSIGWERSTESFNDTYGDGYEKTAQPEPVGPALTAGWKAGKRGAATDNKTGVDPRLTRSDPAVHDLSSRAQSRDELRRFAAGDPKTLYVSRRVENAADIIDWAKTAGIRNLKPADSLHVTIAFSRRPLDWMTIEPEWNQHDDGRYLVQPGGPRRLDLIAPGGPAVLLFNAESLRWRHQRILDAGASWDWPDYHPHITLSDDPGVDLGSIEAYQGPIRLGPERFEEIDEGWSAWERIKRFAESQAAARAAVDDIEASADLLADEGWQAVMEPLLNPLLEQIGTVASIDEARRVLADGITAMSTEALTETLARAGFAARFLEEAKGDEDNG